MNTTKSLVLFVAAALGFAVPAVAAPLAVRLLVAASAVGDSPRAKASNDRKEVEGLLIRARQALKDGDLEMAESVMARAEKLKVEYSVFHLGDTPRKARADLEAAKRKTKKNRFQRPAKSSRPRSPTRQARRLPTPTACRRSKRGAFPPRLAARSTSRRWPCPTARAN